MTAESGPPPISSVSQVFVCRSREMAMLPQPTDYLLAAVGYRKVHRKEVAVLYAEALSRAMNRTDWARVNRAITTRWSSSALRWIKQRAWREIELMARAQ